VEKARLTMVRLEELVHEGPRIHLTSALVKRLLQVHFLGRGILYLEAVFQIRMFLGLPDWDLLVQYPDPAPDTSIRSKKSKKNLDFFCFVASL
jgi:hypothetical protein